MAGAPIVHRFINLSLLPVGWLAEKAAKGYVLLRAKGCVYEFEKTDNLPKAYRADYFYENVSDMIQYRTLCGWEYICSDKNRHFFATYNDKTYNVGTLYKKHVLRQKRRMYLAPMAIALGVSAVLLICAYFAGIWASAPVFITAAALAAIFLALGLRFAGKIFSLNASIKALPKIINNSESAYLTPPAEEFAKSFIEACAEYKKLKLPFYEAENQDQVRKLIKRLKLAATEPEEGQIPYLTFWLIQNGEYIGAGNVRTSLNNELRFFGGHMAYEIRPSQKGKGYEGLMLKLLLQKAKELNLSSARVTCEADDITAIDAIEYNNGHLCDLVLIDQGGKARPTKIYQFFIKRG